MKKARGRDVRLGVVLRWYLIFGGAYRDSVYKNLRVRAFYLVFFDEIHFILNERAAYISFETSSITGKKNHKF